MFCERCGRNIVEGTTYCPECGFPVRGDVPPSVPQQRTVTSGSSTLLVIASIAVLLYALVSLFFGIGMLVMGDTVIATLEQNPTTLESFGISIEDIKMIMPTMIAVFLVSGIFSSISAYFSITRKRHVVAVLSCFAASVTMLATLDLLSLMIGLFVTFAIYTSKEHFQS